MKSAAALLALAVQAPAVVSEKVELDLPILPGAVDVVRGGSADAPFVRYELREAYPAPESVGRLLRAMEEKGWTAVEVSGFESWGPLPTHVPAQLRKATWAVHQWEGRWHNRTGWEAQFSLRYMCPLEESGMHSVWVQVAGGALSSAEVARRAAERRKAHEHACLQAKKLRLPIPADCGK